LGGIERRAGVGLVEQSAREGRTGGQIHVRPHRNCRSPPVPPAQRIGGVRRAAPQRMESWYMRASSAAAARVCSAARRSVKQHERQRKNGEAPAGSFLRARPAHLQPTRPERNGPATPKSSAAQTTDRHVVRSSRSQSEETARTGGFRNCSSGPAAVRRHASIAAPNAPTSDRLASDHAHQQQRQQRHHRHGTSECVRWRW